MKSIAIGFAFLVACGSKPMVVCWVTRSGVEEPVYLRKDYGVLVQRIGSENVFYLFDKPRERVSKTESLDRFLEWIDPLGSVEWIDKCCCPFSYGMTEQDLERIWARVRIGERNLICTCESKGLRLASP